MPQAKKSTRTRAKASASRAPAFKEPAALKRLTKSLDAAHDALGDLRKDFGRNTGAATRELQKHMRTSLTGSRRDIGKLVKALQKDFDSAQTKVAAGARSTTRAARSSTRTTSSRATSGRATSSRATSSRGTSGRGTRSRTTRARSSKSS